VSTNVFAQQNEAPTPTKSAESSKANRQSEILTTATTNHVAKFDSAGEPTDSSIIEDDAGKVGIGVTAPQNVLHVRAVDGVPNAPFKVETTGTNSITAISLKNPLRTWHLRIDGSDSGKFKIFDANASASRLTIDNSGNVGVGTSVPGAPFHLYAAATADSLLAVGTDAVLGPAASFGYSGASYGRSSALFNVRPDALADAPNPALRFATVNVVRMIITNSGKVGIGTTPAASSANILEVAGDAYFSGTVTGGNIKANYQDLAEWVPAKNDMPPGTVVVINPEASNEVMPSSRPYDTTVAGVVSAQPGILLGIAGAGKEQIATTGRVKVHVDATAGAIGVGDLLVTSDTPGMAMRSQPLRMGRDSFHRPGTIIGKALEPLAGGVGEILVLLSMQ
jgi:hypothetical protein